MNLRRLSSLRYIYWLCCACRLFIYCLFFFFFFVCPFQVRIFRLFAVFLLYFICAFIIFTWASRCWLDLLLQLVHFQLRCVSIYVFNFMFTSPFVQSASIYRSSTSFAVSVFFLFFLSFFATIYSLQFLAFIFPFHFRLSLTIFLLPHLSRCLAALVSFSLENRQQSKYKNKIGIEK